MPLMKQLDRSSGAVTIAFCPERGGAPNNGALFAAGTVAGAVDVNFSSSSLLELVAVDFAAPGDACQVLGSVQAPDRFNRLAWGTHLAGDATFPKMGLLAGGLADGSVVLWDPSAILANQPGRQPMLAKMQKHVGAVKGLEFNTFSPNLLATGAADSDLCIWDLAKPATPSLYPALKSPVGPGSTPGTDIVYLSWNRKVQHILASCCSNGTTVVWDLKKQKPVISFRDPTSQRRASVLQWNPEVATQLVVASEDDRSPTLQMWDLRNSVAPLKEFVGHSKGVLGMAWCQQDPSLLLSCGKDNRNVCWDVQTADVMCELPTSHNWNFDIAWAPNHRGVFATASFDGKVGFYNLHACTSTRAGQDSFNADFSLSHTTPGESKPLKRVPNWMKRPCAATFGFGGRLAIVTSHKVAAVDANGQPVQRETGMVTLKHVVTEDELVRKSEQFEQAIAGGDKSTLHAFCASKAQAAEQEQRNADEAETWAFLSLLFDDGGRRELLKQLGFGDALAKQASVVAPDANGGVAGVTAGVDGLGLGPDGKPVAGANGVSGADDFFGAGAQEDDPDFFDKLPEEGIMAASPAKTPSSAQHKDHLGLGGSSLGGVDEGGAALAHRLSHGATGDLAGSADASHELEDEVQRAMIAGNYEAAVETCFKAHRLADALLIANVFNVELFKKTMHRYMKMSPKPYMSIIRATVDNDFEGMVRQRPVSLWRETLALLATYTAQEDWAKYCELLAGRLAASGMHHAALLCHICAGNLDAAVAHWMHQTLGGGGGAAPQVDKIQEVMEKSVIMGYAMGSSKPSPALSELVTSYAGLLAAQGRLSTALDYLDRAPGEASTTVAVLRDRIYRSGAAGVAQRMPPPFPFVMEDVKASPVHQQPQQPHQQPHTQQPGGQYPNGNQYQQPGGYYQNNGNPQPAAPAPVQPAYDQWGRPTQPVNPPQPTPAAHQHTPQWGNGGTATAASHPAYPPSGYGGQPPPPPPSAYPRPGAATSFATPANPVGVVGLGGGAPGGYGGPQPAAPPPPPPAPASAYNPQPSFNFVNTPAPVVPPPPPARNPPAYGGVGTPTGGSAGGAAATWGAPPPPPPPVSTQQPLYPSGSSQGHYAAPAPQFTPTTPSAYNNPPAPPPPPSTHHQQQNPYQPQPPPHPAVPAAPPPPAKPQGPPEPPPNVGVANVDTSKVAAEHRAVVTSLTNLYNACLQVAGPAKKREMEDNSKKVGQFLWRLNQGDVSPGVVPKLLALCQAIDGGDWGTANQIQVQMTTMDWDECGFWLPSVKRMIKMRSS